MKARVFKGFDSTKMREYVSYRFRRVLLVLKDRKFCKVSIKSRKILYEVSGVRRD